MSRAASPLPIAAVYARVSTDEQAREGTSLGEQQRQGAERARADGHRLEDAHVYVDAMSGSRADRPDYQRMLADAAAGAFEALYVWKFDRLGRDAEELLRARRMLEAAGVTIVSLTEGEAESTLVYGVRALVAQEEREKIAERVRSGMTAIARTGRRPGGKTPIGYRTTVEGGWEIDDAEALIVHRIDELYLGGLGSNRVAASLNEAGVRTRHGSYFRAAQVLHILDNPAYVGLIVFNGETYPGQHEPIRSDETWQRIRALRGARKSSAGGGRGGEPLRHLLTKGMLRCVCGSGMYARSYHGRDYYLCSRREVSACEMPTVRREAVDEPLLAIFETHVLDVAGTVAQIRREAEHQIGEARQLASASLLEVGRIDDSLGRVRADYLAGDLDAPDWKQLRSDLETDRAGAAAEADRHERRAAELASEADRLDAEEEFAAQIAELRNLVAGRVSQAGTVDAIRAALTTTFEQFDLVETDEGFVAVPRLRLDRRLEVARTPDELLLPARRVALARESSSVAQTVLPSDGQPSLVDALFAAIPVAVCASGRPAPRDALGRFAGEGDVA